MEMKGFWANISLLVASLLLVMACLGLPLFTVPSAATQSPDEPSSQTEATLTSVPLYGPALAAQMTRLNTGSMVSTALSGLAWGLLLCAGVGGVLGGALALVLPQRAGAAAFEGVVCGVIALVSALFLRFQYANITATSLFDSTAVGWWVILLTSAVMIGQGSGARLRPKIVIYVPQPPPLPLAQGETSLPARVEMSSATPATSREAVQAMTPADEHWHSYTYGPARVLSAPHVRLMDLRTQQQYPLDLSQPVSIGRSKQNHITLSDVQISRQHAVIRWRGD